MAAAEVDVLVSISLRHSSNLLVASRALGMGLSLSEWSEDECTLTLIDLGGGVALLIWGVHMARIAGAYNEKLAFEACI